MAFHCGRLTDCTKFQITQLPQGSRITLDRYRFKQCKKEVGIRDVGERAMLQQTHIMKNSFPSGSNCQRLQNHIKSPRNWGKCNSAGAHHFRLWPPTCALMIQCYICFEHLLVVCHFHIKFISCLFPCLFTFLKSQVSRYVLSDNMPMESSVSISKGLLEIY